MFKQIYNREDGKPKLIESDEEGIFKFDKFIYTDIAPTPDLYEPMYFDGNEWIGSTKEEYEESLPKEGIPQPSASELMMADTQMQVAESSFQLRDTQKKLAQTLLDGAEKDKRIETLEELQAQILLEITEMKGVN